MSAATDAHHQHAIELADQIEMAQTHMVTARAVVIEIGNALSKPRYRSAAVALIDALEADPRVEIVPVTEALYSQALILFRARPDKKWGLTDCISFVVMHERGIADALTTDEDFEQAGFRALLRASRL
ncbi:MAG TPA: PIN domain-containing protein [Herpetosiphonaceae bacterium]|nr:PIN domain-containing protein [Herpetosiphonaceae bacterium]